jgi:ABC-type uncharacterized transport system substrate-binding protein
MRQTHFILITFLILLGTMTAQAQNRILVVHSYHEGYSWTDAVQAGIDRALGHQTYDIKIHYMDTKRQTDEAWKIQSGRNAMQVVAEFKPDIVIASDDNAQLYFASALSNRPDAPRIVFCGINGNAGDYGYPNKKATGIITHCHSTTTLKLAQALKPSIQRVSFISDQSLTTKKTYDFYKTQKFPVKVEGYWQVENFSQWKALVLRANMTSDAILVTLYHTIKRSSQDTQSMPPEEVMKWTVENSKVPILGVYPFAVRDGAVMGICSAGEEHGYLAAITAMDMLQTGRPASRYPINTSVEGRIMFNLQSARQHQIQIPDHLQKMAILINSINKASITAKAKPE